MALLLLSAQEDPRIADLHDKDWTIRRNAAETCGKKGVAAAVYPLIDLTRDEKAEVRDAAQEALKALTAQNFVTPQGQPDYAAWRAWWEREGAEKFGRVAFDSRRVREIVDPIFNDFDKKLRDAKTEIRYLSVAVTAVGVIFVLMMFYFVGHVSSKLKEWKELVAKAETYIKKGEEINTRTDKIVAELDAKKTEIMEFFAKVKEDNQAEFERYCDILQKNLEHKMREEVMALRQKAEKELEQTLAELRTQVDHEIRRGASEHREKLEKEVTQRRQTFLKEVEAEQLYLQAQSLMLKDRPEEAQQILKKLLADRPAHPLAWNDLGRAYHKMRRFEEALDAYKRALEIQPGNARALYNLAATYARLRQREKMLETLALAVQNDGEFKDEALNDEEFREFWNDPKFKDLAEA
jgi:tetratricopeptide (TPR) repeat protein